ncbi:MAG: hypothetical protein E2P05_07250 [Acidobacteria bacterium]|nr:MAG: hypothetical protein E2P05_07250 [Acidobacteriota bacterium]
MAQTERDNVVNRTNLADNTAGDISETDMRDALASMMGYGSMVLTVVGAPAVMNGVGTSFVLINVFDQIQAKSIDVNTNGTDVVLSPDWKITFNSNGFYQVNFYCSFSSSQNNRLYSFAAHVNGGAIQPEIDQLIGNGADTQVVAGMGIASFNAGDFIDIRVKVSTGTADLTFLAAGFSAHRVG